VKAGSGQRAQGGHAGQGFCLGHAEDCGHLGQTGGTMEDFNTYKWSSPSGILERRIPFCSFQDLALFFKPSFNVNPVVVNNATDRIIKNKNVLLYFIIYY
jgi:hypothetical protein